VRTLNSKEMTPEEEKPTLQIVLQPDGVVAPILIALKECSQTVLFGLKSIDQMTSLPESIVEEDVFARLEFGEQDPFDIQKSAYKNWLISKGFEELMEGVKHSLIEAYKFVSIIELCGGKSEAFNTTYEKINSDFEELRKNASKQSLPGLLSKVKSHLKDSLTYETHITSLNKTRNCLVHRKGIVTPEDVNTTNDTLQIKWARNFIFADTKDGEVEIYKGYQNATDDSVEIKLGIKEAQKEFNQGENIVFSYKEINEFMTTCHLFVLDVANKLPK